jgi:ankyrin repeat protein
MFCVLRLLTVAFCLTALAAAPAAAQSISSAKLPPPADTKVDFNTDVRPILASKCFGCHSAIQQQSGLRLDRRQEALRGGDYGVVIVPGKSAESRLILRLVGGDFGLQMPPTGPLSPEEIGILRAWIDQGGDYPDVVVDESAKPKKPIDPQLQLLIAEIRKGSTATLGRLQRGDPLVSATDPNGATPLMYAALYGNEAVMRVLLENGADPNAKSARGASALHWGIHDIAKVRLLVSRGGDVNAKTVEGKSPLYLAASQPGGTETVQLLLDKGADPNVKDIAGRTPLMAAAVVGNVESIGALIASGANIGAATQAGLTALMEAARYRNAPAVKLLIEKGADVNTRTKRNNTAIAYAAASGNAGTVKLLLDHGARVDVLDERNYSPLMYAAYSESMPVEIVRMLLAKGADTRIEGEGETALSLAKKRGDTEIVRLIAEKTK